MSTHNICIHGEIREILMGCHLLSSPMTVMQRSMLVLDNIGADKEDH